MMEGKEVVCAQEWAEQTYGADQLGHVARTRRAVVIAAAMAAEPAGSVPAQQHSQAATKPVYRACETAHVTYEALMQPHWQQTGPDASRYQQVLLVQDTTQVDYQAHPTTTGLGPIGNGTHHGFLLQSVLAIEPMSHEVLGVLHQEPCLRQPAPKGERSQQRAQRAHEAQVWERAVAAIGSPPAGVHWIHVGDRGSDDLAFMRACEATRTHFLIRVAQDRLVDEEVQRGQEPVKPRPHRTRRPEEQQPEPLKQVVARWPVRGAQVVDVPAEHKRQARAAQLSLSWGQGRRHPPQDSKDPDRRPMVVWVLHVWEELPPEGVEALEWYLLPSVPIPTPPPPRVAALPTHAAPTPRWDAGRDPWSLAADAAAPVPNSDSAEQPEPAAYALLAHPPPVLPALASGPPPASTAPVVAPPGAARGGDAASPVPVPAAPLHPPADPQRRG